MTPGCPRSPAPAAAADLEALAAELRVLREQNAALKAHVERQQIMLEELARRQAEFRVVRSEASPSVGAGPSVATPIPATPVVRTTAAPVAAVQKLGKLHLSGEGAVAYFGGLTHYHAHGVVEKHPLANDSPWVNFNTGEKP